MRASRYIPPNRQMLLLEQANMVRAEFLRIDTQVVLTFSGIALSTTDIGKRERTSMIARRAYDTILKLRAFVWLTDIQTESLADNLERLHFELKVLGEFLQHWHTPN